MRRGAQRRLRDFRRNNQNQGENGSVSVCGHSLKIKEISDSEIYIIGIIKGHKL